MNPDSSTVRPVMRLEFPKKEKDAGPTEEEQGMLKILRPCFIYYLLLF